MNEGADGSGGAGQPQRVDGPTEEVTLARVVEEYKVLVETSAAFAVSTALDDTLTLITRLVAERLDVAWCDLYDYDAEADEFVVTAFSRQPDVDADTSAWLGMRYDAENWPDLWECVAERRAAILYRDDPDLPAEQRALMDQWGELANISVPLVYKNEVTGLIDIGECRAMRRWSEDDVHVVQAIADQAAIAIANARAYARLAEQAVTDELTGLLNFRHFMEHLRREVARARRYGQDVSVLVVDLDGFGLFNQTFGREQGDTVLVEVADILREVTRGQVDVVARYAADEFIVILPQTRANEPLPLTAPVVAERIREAVAAHRFKGVGDERDVAMTASIGVAGVGLGGYSAEELLSCADKAAYLAKHDGRDRVVVFGA
jgi:diguanylate cyclase (GGDEF)-like protein